MPLHCLSSYIYSVKLIAAILSILVLSIFIEAPCADELDISTVNTLEQKQAENHSKETPENETDDCSPFCACNCCQTQITGTRFSFSSHTAFIRSEIAENRITIPLEVHLAIWEPPQYS